LITGARSALKRDMIAGTNFPQSIARTRQFVAGTRLAHQLQSRYSAFHGSARLPIGLAKRASAPLLIYPHDRWQSAAVRLLVIGQETLRWRYEPSEIGSMRPPIRNFKDFSATADGAAAMCEMYRWFALARRFPTLNSPFWRAFRLLDGCINPLADSALWTNLFKINVSGSVVRNCTVSEIRAIQHAQEGLLGHEVDVLKPDVVVFFTGPSYDKAIQCAFPKAEFHPLMPEFTVSELAIVNAPGLPAKAIRTYHPVYLQRSRRWPVLPLIAEWAQCQAA
jgi:hypothetical protein